MSTRFPRMARVQVPVSADTGTHIYIPDMYIYFFQFIYLPPAAATYRNPSDTAGHKVAGHVTQASSRSHRIPSDTAGWPSSHIILYILVARRGHCVSLFSHLPYCTQGLNIGLPTGIPAAARTDPW